MAKINRYNGNVPAFAKDSTGLERTLFGDTAQANDLDSNINLNFLRGWGIVGPNENPTKQDFNAAFYTLGHLIAYLHQMGVPEWVATQEYFAGSVVTTANGVYRLKSGGNGTLNPDTDDGTNWESYALKGGDATQRFKVADAVEDDEAVNKGQTKFRGALAHANNGTTSGNYINYAVEVYDTDNIYDPAAPSRLTVPAGVSMVRLSCSFNPGTAGAAVNMKIHKNGAVFNPLLTSQSLSAADGECNISGPVLPVSPGDYFQVYFTSDGSSSNETANWFAMEIIE